MIAAPGLSAQFGFRDLADQRIALRPSRFGETRDKAGLIEDEIGQH
jgi:hypothetical protein